MKPRVKTEVGLKLSMFGMFVIGLLIFMYPFVMNSVNNLYDQQRLNALNERVETDRVWKEQTLANMREKNKEANPKQVGVDLADDLFDQVQEGQTKATKAYLEEHGIGMISIPSVGIQLPLFDTTNATLLSEGATLLQGTSQPIGGDSTHSAITGHTGLSDKKLFTDLSKVSVGERLYLSVVGEELAYEVESTKVVLPHDIEALDIQEGRDLLTLVTCTPYGINSHRLLVTAHRIPFEKEAAEKGEANIKQTKRLSFVAYLIGIVALLMVITWFVRRQLKKLKN